MATDDDGDNDLGVRVRRLREERGWTQAHLAARIHVASETMSRIESGETPSCSATTLFALAQAFFDGQRIGDAMRFLIQGGDPPPTSSGARPPTSAATLAKNLADMMQRSPDLRSQAAVAQRSGIAERTIGTIFRREAGITVRTLDAVAGAFDVPVWMLLHPDPDQAKREADVIAAIRAMLDQKDAPS